MLGDQFSVAVTYEGPAEVVRTFAFKTPGIETQTPLDQLDRVILTYTRTLPVGTDGTVVADGFTFSIDRNDASSYGFAAGEAYTFKVTEIMFLPIVIIILLLGALFFTIYFRFVNVRKFKLAIDVVRGKYSDPNEEGEVSHFQALTAALSGTVGLGNIAGVAIAISIGGAGATLWMVLAGLLGMSSKFVECTLGVKYRTIDARGEVSGGPMYYLSRGLAKRGWGVLGRIFAGFFAIMCIGGSFGGGNMFQVNQAFQQFAGLEFVQGSWISSNGWMFGVIMAALVAVVILGGIRSIAKVTDKIVPFMCGIYVLAALVIIGMNITEVPRVFAEIFAGAFAPTAIAGGFVGVLIQGFRRAAFSNEAGVGSASIAHSAVKTDSPASEGIVALLEPFIDTVVVCTMTALVIIITDNHLDPGATDGVALTSRAFSTELPFFKYVLSVAVILFAFSTMITWSYYGLKSWTYLFGGSRAADITYKVLFCLFVVVGAAASLGKVTDFSDAMIFAMAFPNVIGLVLLAPEVREELNKYLEKIRTGKIIRVS
ncbi:MAG: alanine:cation symporter family protein [Bacteroidetes bacterium]|nr:MAG: alanine:cation symporter family protein [Bacteroidota bacterium]